MKSLRLGFTAGLVVLAAVALGCAGGSNNTGAGGNGGSAGSSGAAGTTGAAGTSGSTGAAGTIGTGGNATGTAGATATAGTVGTGGNAGGTSGAAGSAGTVGTGGSSGAGGSGGGATGRGGTTGTAGTGGATGTAGTGGSTTPHGSAARFICPQGQTYGNPLTGMGTIQQITEPTPDYFAFLEGPVWIGGTGTLFFSDNARNPERIWKLVPPSTTLTILVMNSGSNGLAVDNSDQIVAAVQTGTLGITRFNPMTGAAGAHVATTATPNDVIVRSDDNVYFTDPNKMKGFYRIAPGGTAPGAAMQLPNNGQPNGIELSTDENTLYVGDVANKKIFKFALAADGTVMTSTGAEFVSQTMNTTVDGMCTDCAGNIYAGTMGGVEVYSPTGTYIGTVTTGLQTSNCTFGGADRKTLYMTTPKALKYVTLAVPGLPD